jgi:hypothetical protein
VKKQFSAFGIFVLALGALATQSCESTDGQNSYYDRGHYGYYHDGRYAQDNGYYREGPYSQENGYYNSRDDYRSNGPGISLHLP